jgi:membrane-anchored protein YejM (alkaline phosphatase superfamily)
MANKPAMGVFVIFYGLTNLPWEFLPSFMNIQTCHGSFCHLLWTDKPAMGVFVIFYGLTNLPWEFLPSFMD